MKHLSCLFLSILFLTGTGCKKEKVDPARNNDTQWIIYNSTNSLLPDNQVNAVAIGKNDVKWIGTANGLVRIREHGWTVFKKGSSGLPSSFIRGITVENDSTVWIGTDKGTTYTSGNRMSLPL